MAGVAGSVLALGLVLGAGGTAQAELPGKGKVSGQGGSAPTCADIVVHIGCYDRLRELCDTIDKAASPPLTRHSKDEMIATVVGTAKEIQQHTLDRASQSLDFLQQRLDSLSGALTPRITDSDADTIGGVLDDTSLCVDGL